MPPRQMTPVVVLTTSELISLKRFTQISCGKKLDQGWMYALTLLIQITLHVLEGAGVTEKIVFIIQCSRCSLIPRRTGRYNL